MDVLKDKFNDYPRDGEGKKTITILAQGSGDGLPKSVDVIYFELSRAIGRVQSLSSEIHVCIFETLPASPLLALGNLAGARTSLWCNTIGVEDDRGGKEFQAGWYVDGTRPVLRRAPRPFRPTPAVDMQQVRARAYQRVHENFQYMFEPGKPAFQPVFDRARRIGAHDEVAAQWESLKLVPPEHLPWFRVIGLQRSEEHGAGNADHAALRELTPTAGSFIFVSMPRRSKRK